MIGPLDTALRLVVAAVLSGIIGFERERQGRPAGFRTHILVGVGSALIMLISIYGFFNLEGGLGSTRDPARLAAQVVSGIGFLGAGTILREGVSVRGLTTAASLWVVAGIGLGVGAGFYLASVITTVIVFVSLHLLSKLEVRPRKAKEATLQLVIRDEPGRLGAVASAIGELGIQIRGISLEPEDEFHAVLEFDMELPQGMTRTDVLERVQDLDGVFKASYS